MPPAHVFCISCFVTSSQFPAVREYSIGTTWDRYDKHLHIPPTGAYSYQ
jgi:hypothetical protein